MENEANIILIKARKYCAYQERCHNETLERLKRWGLSRKDSEAILVQLISEGFINEERFAVSYARGKSRIKGWGRIRIKNELRKRFISDYCINKALSLLDKDEYRDELTKIIRKKMKPGEKLTPVLKNKIARFAMGRGFEPEMVWDALGRIDE